MPPPLISVVCPVLNGERHIEALLQFFINSSPADKELILVDGGSTDRTLSIISAYQQHYPFIVLLNNPRKYVPYALNIAIASSRGQYIARLDAHTEYPIDYLESCLEIARQTGAENVGGYIHSLGRGPVGKGIAFAMSSVFGVGDSGFRTQQKDGLVETVPFGFWPREVFDKYGIFDEDLIRNQDDEFNYRIISKCGKVFQSTRIHSRYYVRDSFRDLFRQYFQYGLFKPLVIRKIGKVVRVRHLIPAFFVLYLLTLPLMVYLTALFLLPLASYFILALMFSMRSRHPFYTMFAFIILHSAYGLGFLVGLITANPAKQFFKI